MAFNLSGLLVAPGVQLYAEYLNDQGILEDDRSEPEGVLREVQMLLHMSE